jgi:hypothetical protein
LFSFLLNDSKLIECHAIPCPAALKESERIRIEIEKIEKGERDREREREGEGKEAFEGQGINCHYG